MTGLAAAGPRWNASCCDSIVVRFTVTFAAVGNESWRLLEALRPFTAATHPGHGCLAWALTVSSDAGHASCLRYREDWSSEVELRDRVAHRVREVVDEVVGIAPRASQLGFAWISARHHWAADPSVWPQPFPLPLPRPV